MLGGDITRLNEISYWFYRQGEAPEGRHFFLMRYFSGDPASHDHEVDDARWFDVPGAQDAQVRQRKAPGRSRLEFLDVHPAALGEPAEAPARVRCHPEPVNTWLKRRPHAFAFGSTPSTGRSTFCWG